MVFLNPRHLNRRAGQSLTDRATETSKSGCLAIWTERVAGYSVSVDGRDKSPGQQPTQLSPRRVSSSTWLGDPADSANASQPYGSQRCPKPFPVDGYTTRVPPEPEGQLPKHDFPPAFAASSLFSAVGREESHTQHGLGATAVTAISPSFSVTWHRQNSICRCEQYTMHLMIDIIPTTQPRWQPPRCPLLGNRDPSSCRPPGQEAVP